VPFYLFFKVRVSEVEKELCEDAIMRVLVEMKKVCKVHNDPQATHAGLPLNEVVFSP